MADAKEDKEREVEEEEDEESSESEDESSQEEADDAARAGGLASEPSMRAGGSADMKAGGDDTALARSEKADLAEGEETEEEDDEEQAAAQLGVDRYVMSGFFAAGMLGAYILGRAFHSAWALASNRDWFAHAIPWLAAVPDEDKSTYSLLVAGVIALVMVIRTYRRPDVRSWSDEVAAELTKVKWPSRKEVTSSTIVVIATSAIATIYLALLDRLWAFVTNLVYGDGGS
jgi:preprotein translocase subunit SecE